MSLHNKHSIGTLWLGFSLILSVVYLFQIAPHAHQAHAQPPSHQTSESHSNHTHSHADHDGESQDVTHHHHALINHLDSHVSQTLNRGLSPDPVISAVVVSVDLGILGRKTLPWTPELPDPPPQAPPLGPCGPRAPPLQG